MNPRRAADAAPVASGALAHERLRRAIVRLELPPGTAVSEQQLGARFDLSKAAVRAALARLRAEGLVLAEPRRGHVVAPRTLRDVGEV
jgi:DNA-binding GntR family transcriptional regulator